MGPPPVSQGVPMRNDDNELVYVKVRPGRVVLERPADAPASERRVRSFAGGQRFITTRGRAKSLAVDVEGPVVAPAADEAQQAEPAAADGPSVPAPGVDGSKADEHGDASPESAQANSPAGDGNTDAPPIGDAEVSAAGDDAEAAGEDDGEGAEDEGDKDEAEQDPSTRRKRARRGGHDRLYRGGHTRAV